MIKRYDHPEVQKAEKLRLKLDRAILDGNRSARLCALRALLLTTGADPSKMDLRGEIC